MGIGTGHECGNMGLRHSFGRGRDANPRYAYAKPLLALSRHGVMPTLGMPPARGIHRPRLCVARGVAPRAPRLPPLRHLLPHPIARVQASEPGPGQAGVLPQAMALAMALVLALVLALVPALVLAFQGTGSLMAAVCRSCHTLFGSR